MKKIQHFFMTYKGLRVKNAIIGVGASIVLLGALFKIMHWEGAGLMLTIGMITEAFIFFFQGAILPPHKDYHWEKVFPGLDVAPELEEAMAETEETAIQPGRGVSPIQALLQQPQLPPETLERLKEAISRIGHTIEQLRDITEAGAASKEFAEKTREVTQLMGEMESAYNEAVASMRELAQASDVTREYREGMEALSGSIRQLNEVYPKEVEIARERIEAQVSLKENALRASEGMRELADQVQGLTSSLGSVHQQLQSVASNGDAVQRLYQQLEALTGDLQQVVDATRQYREGMAQLARNIATLNRIYGSMVSALGIQAQQE